MNISVNEERTAPKRQYEQPCIEVVELKVQPSLLAKSPAGMPDPDPGSVEEIDW